MEPNAYPSDLDNVALNDARLTHDLLGLSGKGKQKKAEEEEKSQLVSSDMQ